MNQEWGLVKRQVGTKVWDRMWELTDNKLRYQVCSNAGDKVAEEVWDQVWVKLEELVWEQGRDQI